MKDYAYIDYIDYAYVIMIMIMLYVTTMLT